ncbi:carboxy methyl transferase for protein phosphatase 2A [Diatrype stigma]|uniref:Carboxy methyl transferase for protein phosphatase 2A n=1 Tax=Diatrype stigma TaxID=117547 RepID=A0AAN9UU85_9PEZI
MRPLTYANSQSQVAQIIPNAFDGLGIVQSLNSAIVTWAQCLNSTDSPIWVVDQYAGFSSTADLRDGLHPNDSGDRKMANVWYPALVNAFSAARADKLLETCQACWSAKTDAATGQEPLVRAD